MLYTVALEDGSIFKGGNLKKSLWNNIPDLIAITEWRYNFQGRHVVLKGYEAYNHIIVYAKSINASFACISEIILCAKKGQNVIRIHFDFICKTIREDCVPYGKEYLGVSHKGWKLGLYDKKQSVNIT